MARLAFGLENLGLPSDAIRLRVAEMASYFGIEHWFERPVCELSGGQKQLLNLAAVMAMQPRVLVLDEPTAQLDPLAAREFLQTLRAVNRDLGTTVVLSEHRLEDALPIADNVVVLDAGRIAAVGAPRSVCAQLDAAHHPMLRAMPTPARAYLQVEHAAGTRTRFPSRCGRAHLPRAADGGSSQGQALSGAASSQRGSAGIALELRDVWFRYAGMPRTPCATSRCCRGGQLALRPGGQRRGQEHGAWHHVARACPVSRERAAARPRPAAHSRR